MTQKLKIKGGNKLQTVANQEKASETTSISQNEFQG